MVITVDGMPIAVIVVVVFRLFVVTLGNVAAEASACVVTSVVGTLSIMTLVVVV